MTLHFRTLDLDEPADVELGRTLVEEYVEYTIDAQAALELLGLADEFGQLLQVLDLQLGDVRIGLAGADRLLGDPQ